MRVHERRRWHFSKMRAKTLVLSFQRSLFIQLNEGKFADAVRHVTTQYLQFMQPEKQDRLLIVLKPANCLVSD